MGNQFGLLFAVPSFLGGLARAFDIGDTLTEYNLSDTGAQTDFMALRSDWRAIAENLSGAMVVIYPSESELPSSP